MFETGVDEMSWDDTVKVLFIIFVFRQLCLIYQGVKILWGHFYPSQQGRIHNISLFCCKTGAELLEVKQTVLILFIILFPK